MKVRLWIVSCLAVGLGLTALAGPLSGSWDVGGTFVYDVDERLKLDSFRSTFAAAYSACEWTFGATAVFEKHHFTNLLFETAGSAGAFGLYGVLDFIPQTPSFKYLAGAVNTTIAGVTLYTIGMLHNSNSGLNPAPNIGIGYSVGGFGNVGECRVFVEAQFNFSSTLYRLYNFGYDYVVDRLTYYDACTGVKTGQWLVNTASCNPQWDGLDIYVEYPFACFDLLTTVDFSCTEGFESVCFIVEDICLGLDWLILSELDICFAVQTQFFAPEERILKSLEKTVIPYIDVVVGDCFCFTPVISLQPLGTAGIGGIEFNALLLEYATGQGVTFKAGDLFDNTWGPINQQLTWCFDHSGDLVVSNWYPLCCVPPGYDEYFAVLVDGDACCGGTFSVSVFNWFASQQQAAAFIDWIETEVDFFVDIGWNTSLYVGIDLDAQGLDNATLGATVVF